MWCTQCHTAFSWKTGRIETQIHNPHFYEWQRRNNNGQAPRVAGDIPCDGEMDYRLHHFIIAELQRKIRRDEPNLLYRRIERIVQSTVHLRGVQLPLYRVDHVQNNMELRVAYLMDTITADEFKIRVQRANKQHSKMREMSDIIRLYIQTVADICARLHDYAGKIVMAKSNEDAASILKHASEIVDEVEAIRKYANECFVDIGNTYGSVVKEIRIYPAEPIRYEGPRDVLCNIKLISK